jgi:drug/metabolite transporter (DMT)-like permease
LLWITPALWSVNYLIARIAPGFITPHVLALGRWFLAGLILAVLSRHELWRERDSILRAWREYVVLGSLGMLMCGAWVYWGAQTTSAMNIALIYAAAPVLIAVGAVFWLKESFSWRQTGGVLLALTGVMHVVVKGQWAALSEVTWVLGDGLIMVATACWAAYALLLKKWASPLSPRARLAATCLFGSAVLLPFAAWEWLLTAAPAWTWQASSLVVLAAIFPGVGAYLSYAYAQKILGASRIAASLYLGPLFGGVLAWAVLGESLGWHHGVGACLILPGIYWASQTAAKGS